MAIDQELLQHTAPATQSATCDLFIGVTGLTDAELLRSSAAAWLSAASGPLPRDLRVTIVYPGVDSTDHAASQKGATQLRFATYSMPGTESAMPWALAAAAQRSLLSLAADAQARACVLLHADLHILTGGALGSLAFPVLEKMADLVLPIYSQGPYDGLLNHSILAPLTRALYGKRVHFPLASDFAISSRLVARLLQSGQTAAHAAAGSILWPATAAAIIDAPVAEAHTAVQHGVQTEGLELSAVIAQLVGSLFAEMEHNAPLWQRVRNSHPTNGSQAGPSAAAITPVSADHKPDVKPMIDSFLLGSRSLREVWGMVLPPVTLLELKRLTLVAAERFRMPDELWVRIIYDFALAFRLRLIGRTHLLGALTPLYLGWVASYVNEVGVPGGPTPEVRHEELARAFENGKPYLLRRWRWPDRFNP